MYIFNPKILNSWNRPVIPYAGLCSFHHWDEQQPNLLPVIIPTKEHAPLAQSSKIIACNKFVYILNTQAEY
jgi:hypothetical protein